MSPNSTASGPPDGSAAPASVGQEQSGNRTRFSFMNLAGNATSFLLGGLISAYANNCFVVRSDLRRQLDEAHRDYSHCMAKMCAYRRRYGEDKYAAKFKSDMEGPGAEAPSDAVEVNGCRGLTKDFWRRANYFLDRCATTSDKETCKVRHVRFVRVVKPLDVLADYDESADLYEWKR